MKRRRRPTQSFFSPKGEAAVRLRHFQADAVAHQAGHWRSEIYPSWIDLRIEQKQLHPRRLHPGRLRWNLQIIHLERKMIFQTFIIMFHVNLPRCNSLNLKMVNWKMFFPFPVVYSQVPCESSGVYTWNSGSIHRVINWYSDTYYIYGTLEDLGSLKGQILVACFFDMDIVCVTNAWN